MTNSYSDIFKSRVDIIDIARSIAREDHLGVYLVKDCINDDFLEKILDSVKSNEKKFTKIKADKKSHSLDLKMHTFYNSGSVNGLDGNILKLYERIDYMYSTASWTLGLDKSLLPNEIISRKFRKSSKCIKNYKENSDYIGITSIFNLQGELELKVKNKNSVLLNLESRSILSESSSEKDFFVYPGSVVFIRSYFNGFEEGMIPKYSLKNASNKPAYTLEFRERPTS